MGEAPLAGRRVAITGASGYIGSALARHLDARGAEVLLVSRSQPRDTPGHFARWDGRSLESGWTRAIDGADAVVNLAGRSVDVIKTPDHCDEILRSRIESTTVLGEAFRTIERPPPVLVQMSTAHIVGDPPEARCDESAPPGYGLAPTVAVAWEEACDRAALPEQRVVKLRTSFVLGRDAGALAKLGRLARVGLGGTVGSGRQGMSWLHVRDLLAIIERAVVDGGMRGVYMTTAPNPVDNRTFMRELRAAVGMPIGLPAAEWMVRLGARLVLRTDPELGLYGRYCVPTRLVQEGFEFEFDDVGAALRDLYRAG